MTIDLSSVSLCQCGNLLAKIMLDIIFTINSIDVHVTRVFAVKFYEPSYNIRLFTV